MPTVRKIPRKMIPILIVVVTLAAVAGVAVGVKISSGDPPPKSKPVAVAVNPEIEALLKKGNRNDTADDYFERTSPSFAGAAAGDYNSKFRNLGELLVKDGLSHTIIGPGREMNGSWYEWSERRAPSSDPDAYIRAWRQIVTTMRSVPGQHFKFLWTVYPTGTSVADAWPGSAYVDYIGTDIFDWYGGSKGTYMHTASGALDHEGKWQQILTTEPGRPELDGGIFTRYG